MYILQQAFSQSKIIEFFLSWLGDIFNKFFHNSKIEIIIEVVYKNLKQLKKSNEIFLDLIEHLIANQRKNPLRYFGIGRDLSEDLLDEFEKIVI